MINDAKLKTKPIGMLIIVGTPIGNSMDLSPRGIEAFENADSLSSLTEKLKEKTLSDLQSTAARLGFNPSFERDRLIKVITQEYQRQS